MKDLTSLRAAAEKATPGPWFRSGARQKVAGSDTHSIMATSAAGKEEAIASVWYDPKTHLGFHDAAFIALANPATVLELLDLLTASQARAGELEGAIRWALGEGDSDFGDNIPLAYKGRAGAFWWRTELRRRAALTGGGGEGFRSARDHSGSDVDHDGIKPLGKFCDACQAIPRHGYCNLSGCPLPRPDGAAKGGG